MNEHEQKLWDGLLNKYEAKTDLANIYLRLYGGMFYSILANNHWRTPAATREDKIRDLMKCSIPEQLAVVEYVVRHDYAHLSWVLEEK